MKRPPPGTRDGCLALGGQVSPGLAPAPEPDGSEEERARWEAARIAAALAARPGRGGRQVRVDVAARASVMSPDDLGFSAEVRWLVQASQAFAHSPVAAVARPEPHRTAAP
ncbi:DUF6545 domain-containing protein [Streptomyces sp. NBC_01443]|uniref:DUF6545 domain-containing protein n=1 Tax=Streptomyces sp. NBC_01443 TaxID=2903868 RepID=UPI002B1CC36E|nr:DUF6545 domain-containing protein [Streptomyces sp. NBC_01443]